MALLSSVSRIRVLPACLAAALAAFTFNSAAGQSLGATSQPNGTPSINPATAIVPPLKPSLAVKVKRKQALPPKPDIINAAQQPAIGTRKFYEERAFEKLKQENEVVEPPKHPLEAGRDNEMLVICEAGCRIDGEEVVFSRPKNIPQEKALTPALVEGGSSPATAINPRKPMDCVAGC